MLLITGLPRSGTVWAATALTAAGLSCRSEHVFGLRRRNWLERDVAESSWLAMPFVHEVDVPVVRLVRHPVLVLASVMGRDMLVRDDSFGSYRHYVETHLPTINHSADHLERAVHFVTHWEAPLRERDHTRVHVENPDALAAVLDVAGFDYSDVDLAALRAQLGTKINTRPSRYRPTRDEVLATHDGDAFMRRMIVLGYDGDDWPW